MASFLANFGLLIGCPATLCQSKITFMTFVVGVHCQDSACGTTAEMTTRPLMPKRFHNKLPKTRCTFPSRVAFSMKLEHLLKHEHRRAMMESNEVFLRNTLLQVIFQPFVPGQQPITSRNMRLANLESHSKHWHECFGGCPQWSIWRAWSTPREIPRW